MTYDDAIEELMDNELSGWDAAHGERTRVALREKLSKMLARAAATASAEASDVPPSPQERAERLVNTDPDNTMYLRIGSVRIPIDRATAQSFVVDVREEIQFEIDAACQAIAEHHARIERDAFAEIERLDTENQKLRASRPNGSGQFEAASQCREQQWQYLVHSVSCGTNGDVAQHGLNGWELVSVAGDTAWFKRPVRA